MLCVAFVYLKEDTIAVSCGSLSLTQLTYQPVHCGAGRTAGARGGTEGRREPTAPYAPPFSNIAPTPLPPHVLQPPPWSLFDMVYMRLSKSYSCNRF